MERKIADGKSADNMSGLLERREEALGPTNWRARLEAAARKCTDLCRSEQKDSLFMDRETVAAACASAARAASDMKTTENELFGRGWTPDLENSVRAKIAGYNQTCGAGRSSRTVLFVFIAALTLYVLYKLFFQ